MKIQFRSRLTGQSVTGTLHDAGTISHFPGFPTGIDLIGNIDSYRSLVGGTNADFYLLRTDGTTQANAAVPAALTARFSKTNPLRIDTTTNALSVGQSSLAGLNLDGLGRIETLYTLLMATLGVTIFVFGLLLRRRREYITVRALGIRMGELRGLVLGEAGIVALTSLIIGGVVGAAMAWMFAQILRQVFLIPPASLSLPTGELLLLGGLVLGAVAVASTLASATLHKLRLVEILRED